MVSSPNVRLSGCSEALADPPETIAASRQAVATRRRGAGKL
jgi:hypothetical protein